MKYLYRNESSSATIYQEVKVLRKFLSSLCPHLTDDHVSGFKMAAVHLGGLPRNGLDLDTHFLAFLGTVNSFVIQLDAGDHANVHKL